MANVQFKVISKANWDAATGIKDSGTFYRVQNTNGSYDLYLGEQLLSNQDEINAAVGRLQLAEGEIDSLQTLTAGFDGKTIKKYIDDAIAGVSAGELAAKIQANTDAITAINDTSTGILAQAKADSQTKVNTLKTSEIDPLKGRMTTAEGEIDALQSAVGDASKGLVKDVADLKTENGNQATAIQGVQAQVTTLVGADSSKSVREIAGEEINTIIGAANSADDINNVKDLIDYVNENGADLAAVVAESNANKTWIDSVKGGTAVPQATNANTLDGKDSTYFAVDSEVDAALDLKADKSTTYTKTEVNTELAKKANVGDAYTKTEADALLSAKANSADVYTKTQVNTELGKKANAAEVYTKEAADALLEAKANKASTLAGYGIENAYTKADVYTKTETNTAINNTVTPAITSAKDELKGTDGYTSWNQKSYATSIAGAKSFAYDVAMNSSAGAVGLAKTYTDEAISSALNAALEWEEVTSL